MNSQRFFFVGHKPTGGVCGHRHISIQAMQNCEKQTRDKYRLVRLLKPGKKRPGGRGRIHGAKAHRHRGRGH